MSEFTDFDINDKMMLDLIAREWVKHVEAIAARPHNAPLPEGRSLTEDGDEAFDLIYALTNAGETDVALDVILRICTLPQSTDALALLGAGPLEDWMNAFCSVLVSPETRAQNIETLVNAFTRYPRLREALRHVWPGEMGRDFLLGIQERSNKIDADTNESGENTIN